MLTMLFGGRLIQFLLGPAGRIVLLALALGAWTLYHRVDATKDCEADQLRADLIETQRQLEIARQIADSARDRADKTEQEMAEIERLYDELTQDQSTGAVGSCPISPAVRDRLLRIK